MRAFEVFLNGKRLCVAGIDGDGVLSAILTSVRVKARDELGLAVGGFVSATREQVNWTRVDLKVGEEVRVRVVETVSADEPETRERPDPEHELERQKNHVRDMAKKLGWTLIEESTSDPPAVT